MTRHAFLLCFALANWAPRALAQEPAPRPSAAGNETGILPLWIEGSKQEGEMVWYAALASRTAEGLAGEFEKAYPWIKVRAVAVQNRDILKKWDADKAGLGPKPDLLTVRDGGMRRALSGQDRARLRLLRHMKLPCGWLSPEHLFYVYTHAARFALAYNPALLEEAELPSSWAELAVPRWKGRVAALDPAHPTAIAFYRPWIQAAGTSWLEGLAANEPLFAANRRELRQLVARSTTPLLGLGLITEERLRETPRPGVERLLEYKLLEGPPAQLYLTAFNKPPPHPYSTSLFLHWLLSPEAQAEAGRVAGFIPITQDSCVELRASVMLEEPGEMRRLGLELRRIFKEKAIPAPAR